MILALAAAALLLTAFDCVFTERWLRKYGIAIEDNPNIRWLARYLGIRKALLLALVTPSILIVGVFGALSWPVPLAFYVGVRTMLAYGQIQSLRLELQLTKARAAVSSAASHPSQPGR